MYQVRVDEGMESRTTIIIFALRRSNQYGKNILCDDQSKKNSSTRSVLFNVDIFDVRKA